MTHKQGFTCLSELSLRASRARMGGSVLIQIENVHFTLAVQLPCTVALYSHDF